MEVMSSSGNLHENTSEFCSDLIKRYIFMHCKMRMHVKKEKVLARTAV